MCIYFLCGGPLRVCIFPSFNHLPSRPGPPPEGAREVVRPGRRAARGGLRRAGKGGGKRRPAGRKRRDSARYRCPRLSVTNCAELARKFPNSRRNGVDSCQKGELASLLYPEIPGGNSPAIKIPGNGEKRAHAN